MRPHQKTCFQNEVHLNHNKKISPQSYWLWVQMYQLVGFMKLSLRKLLIIKQLISLSRDCLPFRWKTLVAKKKGQLDKDTSGTNINCIINFNIPALETNGC